MKKTAALTLHFGLLYKTRRLCSAAMVFRKLSLQCVRRSPLMHTGKQYDSKRNGEYARGSVTTFQTRQAHKSALGELIYLRLKSGID